MLFGEYLLLPAICQELAGQTISLKEITATRNWRRHQLRKQLSDRWREMEGEHSRLF